jgi:acetylglutamate kinase
VVIKYGGHAMGQEAVAKQFAADVVLLKLLGVHPVVVHGGGPQISRHARAGRREVDLHRRPARHRRSDHGSRRDGAVRAVNKEIANWITLAGKEADVRGVGLSGKDAGLITVEKTTRTKRDPDSNDRAGRRPGLRRRTDQGRPKLIAGPDRRRRPTTSRSSPRSASPRPARPSTSTPTPWPARSRARSSAKRMLLLTDIAGVLDKKAT